MANYTKDECKDSYLDLKIRMDGIQPSMDDFIEDTLTPSRAPIMRLFGSWNKFIIECGDKPLNQKENSGLNKKNPTKYSVFANESTLSILGDRNKSRTFNNLLLRIDTAVRLSNDLSEFDIEIGKELIQAYGKYSDQEKLLHEFSIKTGRTNIESIIALEMIERDLK